MQVRGWTVDGPMRGRGTVGERCWTLRRCYVSRAGDLRHQDSLHQGTREEALGAARLLASSPWERGLRCVQVLLGGVVTYGVTREGAEGALLMERYARERRENT